jgi:hypothetical protein
MSQIIAELNTLFETAKTVSPEEQKLFCRIAAIMIEEMSLAGCAAAKRNTRMPTNSSQPMGAACPGG